MRQARSRGVVGTLCVLASFVLVSALALSGCAGQDETTTITDPTTNTTDFVAAALAFPVDDYTIQTKKVGVASGTVSITYHSYQDLTYVAYPVDAAYQSLDIAVPVKIDGADIDPSGSPILLDITVDDYLSLSSSKDETTTNADLALAAGYVVVSPGCRGSDNLAADGTYYGKAPAAIVDVKCAVKYLRYNDGLIPGSADRIVSMGVSASGGLSALLGASGNSDRYQPYFEELGAAPAGDAIYASAAYCPITDLDHADGAYEWQFGTAPLGAGLVDQALSAQLASGFSAYLTSLSLVGRGTFGAIGPENYGDYITQTYLLPAANDYLATLPEAERQTYLAGAPWISSDSRSADFAWSDYTASLSRSKSLPAYDSFDLSTPECRLFGDADTDARHFTEFSLRQTGVADSPVLDPNLEPPSLDADLQAVVELMNPMYFVSQNSSGCVRYWWLRQAARGTETSLPVVVTLATALEDLGKEVNAALLWEDGPCTDQDSTDFIDWIEFITTSGG